MVELEVIGTQPIPDADYTAVDAAIKTAESLEAENYKDFSAVTAAVAAVVRGKDATEQLAVNKMAEDIFKAIAELERTQDKILSDALVLEDAAASDAAKAEAVQSIKAAKDALIKLSQEELEAEEAAKNHLADAIKKAEAYKDASKYTKDSWQIFSKALEAAKGVLNGVSTKAEYESALKTLNAAVSGLKSSEKPISEGGVYAIGDYNYKVTSLSKQTVEVAGIANANLSKIDIKETVTLGGKSYTITSVGNGAFKNNQKVTSAVIGKNVIKVGNSAFEGCKKLKKVTIKSKKLTQIGKKAFAKCKNLKKITIKSKKVKKIPKNAFKGIHKKAVIKNASKKK